MRKMFVSEAGGARGFLHRRLDKAGHIKQDTSLAVWAGGCGRERVLSLARIQEHEPYKLLMKSWFQANRAR